MKRKKTLLAATLAASVALVGLVSVQSQATENSIEWTECGDIPGAECGQLEVPVDWEDSDSDTIALQVTRRTATDPDKRIGALFYNPGGPGMGAAELVRDDAEDKFSPQLRERFDLIGIDPRGVAGSQLVECGLPVHDPAVTQFPRDEQQYAELTDHNAAVGDSCDDLIAHVDTASVAHDFDAVRQAIDEETISYFGQSYGAIVGTSYAQRYPERLRAMSIDGVVDHGMSADDMVVEGAAAVERSFEDFVTWCQDDSDCAWHDEDVSARWEELLATAEAEPIPVTDAHPMTAEELRHSTYAMLNVMPEFGPQMSQALQEASEGDATSLGQIRFEALEYPATTAPYRAVLCQDIDPEIDGPTALKQRMAAAQDNAAHMRGTSEFWDMTAGCLGWPQAPSNPQGDFEIEDVPPTLLVGNTIDPATPVEWAKSLSQRIAGSQVLTYEGAGHTAYLRSQCATDQIDSYLTTAQLPDSRVCQEDT